MKILVVLSRLPYPLEKGDKLRAFFQIKELAQKNDVYLFCLNNSPIHPEAERILLEFVKEIHIAGFGKIDSLLGLAKSFFDGTPLQTGFYSHPRNISAFKAFANKTKPDVIFYQFVRMAKYSSVDFPKVLDFQDALSANMEGRAKKSNIIKKFVFNFEASRLRKYEAKMFDLFEKLTIIVEADKKAILHPLQEEIEVLPNGVDDAYFEYNSPQNKEYDIIFSGGMSYAPNVDAANFLAKQIMPLVWEKLPMVRLVIAGANPASSVKNLASERVIVTGWVEDMKEWYGKSKLFVAPMQIGTGLQNKLLEAMAMGLPCVSSPLANDALCAKENKEILLATEPKDYAEKILSLLNNQTLAENLAQEGNRFVKQNYNWQTNNQNLEKILSQAIEKRRK